MIRTLKSMLFQVCDDPDLLPTVAKIYRKLFDELKKQGFSDEQALQIVINYKIGE